MGLLEVYIYMYILKVKSNFTTVKIDISEKLEKKLKLNQYKTHSSNATIVYLKTRYLSTTIGEGVCAKKCTTATKVYKWFRQHVTYPVSKNYHMNARLIPNQRKRAVGLVQMGATHAFVARTFGCSHIAVINIDDILHPTVLPFLQQQLHGIVCLHDNARHHIA